MGRWAVAVGIAALAWAGAAAMQSTPVALEPGGPGWARCLAGVGPDGALRGSGLLRVPGVDRRLTLELRLEAEGPPRAGRLVLRDAVAGRWTAVPEAAPGLWRLPASTGAGLRVLLEAREPLRLRRVEVVAVEKPPARQAWLLALWAGALAAAAAAAWGVRAAAALGLGGAGLALLALAPLALFWTLPQPGASLRLLLAAGMAAAGAALGLRRVERRRFAAAAGLLAAAVFGAWVRAWFLPAAGGWDVDYWKACTLRVASHGVTRAYGDPGSVPPGRFLAQLRGEEPLWEAAGFGRTFVVDQPPGIMLLWRCSWWLVTRWGGWGSAEADTVAAKLPPVLGDLLAVAVLLWAFRGEGLRGPALAALYWALPASWLSSAVLGFFDGSFVALCVAALVLAGRGRAAAAGAALALAALVKATALLAAPAVAAALWAARAPLRRALAAGAALVAAALVPFAADGTLAAAVVHCYRILFQKRLSGGFANPWWIAGHVASLGERGRGAGDPVPFVHVHSVPLPVNAIGAAAFALAAAYVLRTLVRRGAGPRAAALAGGALVLAYGMCAVGVHENHPHPFVLALLASGLYSRRLKALAAVLLSSYVLNMLALSGLGRFYGLRHMILEPLLPWVQRLRVAPGFDITLALAAANVAAFVALLAWLPREPAAPRAG